MRAPAKLAFSEKYWSYEIIGALGLSDHGFDMVWTCVKEEGRKTPELGGRGQWLGMTKALGHGGAIGDGCEEPEQAVNDTFSEFLRFHGTDPFSVCGVETRIRITRRGDVLPSKCLVPAIGYITISRLAL